MSLRAKLFLVLMSALTASAPGAPAQSLDAPVAGRERLSLDPGWRFALGHASDVAKDFDHATGGFSYFAKTGFGSGASASAFDDRGWRELDLPHDWAVELPFDPKGSGSHGFKAIGRAFPENSVGWYRKTFFVPASDLGRRISIEFDGVFRDSIVWINGHFLGRELSGYSSFAHNLTEFLNYGGDNVIVVRVDASLEEGWFYEGAGIYRHVWLLKTEPLHVVRHGTYVTSEVRSDAADVTARVEVVNEGNAPAGFEIAHSILDADGGTVALASRSGLSLTAGARAEFTEVMPVANPRLWSLETPHLHKLVTEIRSSGAVVDRYETTFGIRTIRFDPEAGFFLNGTRVQLKGTNNHQDHAGVGAAIPDALQEFRLRELKKIGVNAHRASHNPPTTELLEACDRLGVLVIDENRLMGTASYHFDHLERMLRRDRNHPSIILWSIGNEEWAIEGSDQGARITAAMQAFVKRFEPTRPVMVAISGGWGGGSSTTIDVAGFNYIGNGDTDAQRARRPEQPIVGTEECAFNQTRGIYADDRPRGHLRAYDWDPSRWGSSAEEGWTHYAERPWAAGMFVWTGFDYRGEPTPFGWPAINSQFGILDTCGFPKDAAHYFKSWWTDEDVLHIFPHWNWPGREGEVIDVWCYSNCDEVELLLNGASLGRQTLKRNSHLEWKVPYTPGTLLARGWREGREVATTRVETTGPAATLVLAPDRTALAADGRDVSMIAISAHDAAGRAVPTAGHKVAFSVAGPGRIIGVGNGDPSCHEPDVFVPGVASVKIGAWTAPDPAVTEGDLVFEATFDAPALAPGATATLLLNSLGPKQTVTLNGRALFTDAAPAESRAALSLASLALRPTGNVLRIETPRFATWGGRENLQRFHPATLRIDTPAAGWNRSLFNGLAQIIVQSTGEPGTIELTATAEGLAPATVEITSGL